MLWIRKRAFNRDVHVSLGSLFAEKISGNADSALHEQLLEDDKESQVYRERARPILRELFDHSDFDKNGVSMMWNHRFFKYDHGNFHAAHRQI